MGKIFQPNLTIFHCFNLFNEVTFLPVTENKLANIKTVKLACSSMVKDVYLLRAFEAGADGVVVFVCPEGACRYVEGNLRAKKRVQWVKNLLDEIGLDGRRLSFFNIPRDEKNVASKLIENVLSDLYDLGPNPASSTPNNSL
jgi:coenzyme F420-reducing hydrogenase delta subunit